jgi:DNA helicase HerA-like ATPase
MRSRLGRRQRRPVWVDAAPATAEREFFGKAAGSGGAFDLRAEAAPGRVLVVRVPSTHGDGRGYALFLSYLLREVYRLRERDPQGSPEFLHVIDEAQDIFNAGPAFQAAAGDMLNGHIRKGRSRGIGFVVAVQSADAVPDDIRNNLNSQVIHRHNNHRQAKEAMTRATPEQLALTDTFGPGECLAYLFGASAVIHARMRRSPFNLTKE